MDSDSWAEHVTDGWHVTDEALRCRSEQRMAMTCSSGREGFASSAALKVFVRGRRSRSPDYCCVHALHACRLTSSRPSFDFSLRRVCMAPPHSAAISSDQNSERDMPPLDPPSFKQALPRQQRRSLYRPRSPGQCFICVCCCFSSYRLTKKAWL